MDYYHRECGVLRKGYIRIVLSICDVIVAISQSWREMIISIASRSCVTCIPNPVAIIDNPSHQGSREKATLLFLGRVGRQKGIYELLDAVRCLQNEFVDIRVVIGGIGDIAAVCDYANAVGIKKRVEFLGWIQGEVKETWLARSTVFVLPSYFEGLPLSVLESMAAGLPVVASSVGGVPELVEDGINGLIVPPRDVDALCAALRRLLNDDRLREAMGSASREKIKREYSTKMVMPKIECLYEKLLARKSYR